MPYDSNRPVEAAISWLRSTLNESSVLADVVNPIKVVEFPAPEPFDGGVVIKLMSQVDEEGLNGDILCTTLEVMVAARHTGPHLGAAGPILSWADEVHRQLHQAAGPDPLGYGEVLSCLRVTPVRFVDQDGQKVAAVQVLGGIYRIVVRGE